MKKRTILVTGADGFIGSHFLEHVILNTDANVVCVCSWSKGGLPDRITDMPRVMDRMGGRVTVVTHDLSVPFSRMQNSRFITMGVTDIVHFASDSHVDRSISDPVPFIKNNVSVTLTMLELARLLQTHYASHPMEDRRLNAFVQISTDEVYGPAHGDHRHAEWEPIIPSNPYAASKAAQEAIATAYWRTYGVPVIITNTMNNVGERQGGEKFLPMIVRSVLEGSTLPIHAIDGVVGSRYYLHARNHSDAVLHIIKNTDVSSYMAPGREPPHAALPDRYHVVGEQELSNLELAQYVAESLGRPLLYDLVDGHSARPGHDLRYALNGDKLEQCGWSAPVPLLDSIRKTVQWYVRNPEWLKHTG